MTLLIDYTSRNFPPTRYVGSGRLETSWDDLLWCAITIGRPSTYHVFRHGLESIYEAFFRLSLIRMMVRQTWSDRLERSDAFMALDPTEKGAASYFLGMTVCKLFADSLLQTPWLLHLDAFREELNPGLLGRSRPDLVGQDALGAWHAFETKGRSAEPSSDDKEKAKAQARRLVSVDTVPCELQIGSFAFFRSGQLQFYWADPEPDPEYPIEFPRPHAEWRYYYEPALALASFSEDPILDSAVQATDVKVEIHRKRWRHPIGLETSAAGPVM